MRGKNKKKRLLALLLTGCTLAVTACGSNEVVEQEAQKQETPVANTVVEETTEEVLDLNNLYLEEIIEGAKSEGTISSVGMPDGWANWEMLWADLKDNYGIEHDDNDMSSAEELNIFATEGEHATKDIGDVGQAFGPQAVEQDLVQNYKTSYWDSVYDYAKGTDGSWMIGYMGVTTFLMNSELIGEDMPTSWEDIKNGSYVASALALGEGDSLDTIDLDAAFDFWSTMAEEGRINTVDITKANFESGEVPFGVVWSFTGIPYSNSIENYTMVTAVPSDGSIMSGYASVINKYAPHPYAAALAREVIFSDAGQTYLALAGAVSTRSDYVVPEVYKDVTLQADQYANAYVIEDTEKYSEICANIVERWENEIQPLLVQ